MYISHNFKSINFKQAVNNPIYIILHYTELPFDKALEVLCSSKYGVSAHYLIHENGTVHNLVCESKIAWHAGDSYWQGKSHLNNYSIGIELDNLGDRPFTVRQISSCIALCKYLIIKYNISPANVLGHSDIAPERKIDPGIFFNWSLLASYGIGLWPKREKILKTSVENSVINIQKKLKKIGYKITVNGVHDYQTNSVIRSFLSHFCPTSITSIDYYSDLNNEFFLNFNDLKVLDALYQTID